MRIFSLQFFFHLKKNFVSDLLREISIISYEKSLFLIITGFGGIKSTCCWLSYIAQTSDIALPSLFKLLHFLLFKQNGKKHLTFKLFLPPSSSVCGVRTLFSLTNNKGSLSCSLQCQQTTRILFAKDVKCCGRYSEIF